MQYHEGQRALQVQFDSVRLADRLASVVCRPTLNDSDRAFIETRPMFFLATADSAGRPDCSYKGGQPGFVRVLNAQTLEFPDYDGNGMFRSLGNLVLNHAVGLLFIDFASPRRLRINGHAQVLYTPDVLAGFHGAQLIVRVSVSDVFPNCPRYIHAQDGASISTDAPTPGHTPAAPAWKSMDALRDYLPGTPNAPTVPPAESPSRVAGPSHDDE